MSDAESRFTVHEARVRVLYPSGQQCDIPHTGFAHTQGPGTPSTAPVQPQRHPQRQQQTQRCRDEREVTYRGKFFGLRCKLLGKVGTYRMTRLRLLNESHDALQNCAMR